MGRTRRCLKILSVFFRYRLKAFLPNDKVRWPLRCLLSFSVFFPKKSGPRGERLRLALQELGPVFVKFGQLLSTRRDLLPDDIADELAFLQDRVEPFDEKVAIATIESSLGKPIDELFSEFSATPLASASVAQVHAATLTDPASGESKSVVVKVIRPGIEKVIAEDIKLLLLLARLVETYASNGYRLKPVQIVKDYKHIIFDELDLQREAANCSQLKRNFTPSDQLIVPEVYFDFTSQHVLVMERMYAPNIADMAQLKQANCNLKKLAETGVEIFFTQVFKDNYFHADMHPGNIFVDTSDPEKPKYIALDCAIMGSLSEFDRYYIGRNLLAVFNRDYQLVAKLHVDSGWVPENTNVFEFEAVIRSACEPIFQKPLDEISFGTLLIYLFQAAQRFGMEVQPSLVLLQKTLLNIEGLGRQLYPQLDLWATAHPFLDQWLKDRYSPKRILKNLRKQAPDLLETLPELPDLIVTSLRKQSLNQTHEQQLMRQIASLEKANRRQQRLTIILITAVIATAFALL